MSYPVITIPCGAQSLGGGYTALAAQWRWMGLRPGRTYRFTPVSAGGGTANFGLSYNGGSCDLTCDAWHDPAAHDFLAPASALTAYVIGRNNGGSNLTFTNYTVQDVTEDGDGVTLSQVVRVRGSASCTFSSSGTGSLLVLQVSSTTWTDVPAVSGWTSIGSRTTVGTQLTGQSFYKVSSGGETSVSVTGTTGSTTDIALREYAAGSVVGAGTTCLGSYQIGSQVNFGWGPTTPPSGTSLMVLGLAMSDASGRYLADGSNVGNPYPIDKLDTDGEGSHPIHLYRKVSPSGAQSGNASPSGGGCMGILDIAYFSGPSSARSQILNVG